jgi:putative glutamine amidotransferase
LGLPVFTELTSEGRAAAAEAIAESLDGLLLQGGTDLSPLRFGETPIKPEWAGDPIRDGIEFELVRAFLARGKPLFAICRGIQVLNVALGGSLYQDLPSQVPTVSAPRKSVIHNDGPLYDKLYHPVDLRGSLRATYGVARGIVTSSHHQGIKALGSDLVVEASADDGLVEAVRVSGQRWAIGVQWHPEFHADAHPHAEAQLLCGVTLCRSFVDACR